MYYRGILEVTLLQFQNISCLRFILTGKAVDIAVWIFQNISCLRFIDYTLKECLDTLEFQNISCLRFIRVIGGVYGKNFTISKHFMFKVHNSS